jgi:beta-lactamase superfamily II metal-dependent hydrolase
VPVVPLQLWPVDPDRTMTVHLLDVGQGLAVLLEFPCGAVLVDTGAEVNDAFDGKEALRRQLDAFFDRRADLNRTLDLLVITHPHADHVWGVETVISNYRVKNVVDNGQAGGDLVRESMNALRAFLDAGGVGHRSVLSSDIPGDAGITDAVIDPVDCAPVDPRIVALSGGFGSDPGWGDTAYDRPHFANENNHSVVLRVDFGRASVLLPGDLEDVAQRTLVERYRGSTPLDVDLYVVGHHGSANGTSVELVSAMTPHLAAIPMGPASRRREWTAYKFGHPRAVVIDRLLAAPLYRRRAVEVEVASGQKRFSAVVMDRAIYGTGWDGALVFQAADDGRWAARGRGLSSPGS